MALNNLSAKLGFSPLWTNVVKRFPAQNFAGTQLAVPCIMPSKTGTYIKYGREHFRADGDTRVPGAPGKTIKHSRSTGTYEMTFHSLNEGINWDDVDIEQTGDDLNTLKMGSTFRIRESMLLEREKEIAALATAQASYTKGGVTNYANATTGWNQSGSTLMQDVATGVRAVRSNIGKMPNKIFIPAQVQTEMATQDPFKSQLNYNTKSDTSFLTPYGLPKLFPQFGLEIVTLEALYDAAGLGGSAVSLTEVWGENVIIAYVPNVWEKQDLTFMTTFTYNQYGAGGNDVSMWDFDDSISRASYIEGLEWRDVEVIEELAGYMIQNTLT